MQPRLIINFALFQIGWFACVLGAAKQMPWLGVAVVIAIIIWHLTQAKQAKKEMQLLLITLVIGGTFDQIMLNHQLISYQAHGWSNLQSWNNLQNWNNLLVPVWILALWAEFVTVLNVSLRWMKEMKSRARWLVAILFGAVGGPLAYMGAEKLGAVTLNNLPASYIALSVGWALITPLLLKLSTKFDGFQ